MKCCVEFQYNHIYIYIYVFFFCIFVACFARADVTISDSSIPGGPHYEAMFSSKGLNFPGGKDSRFVTIYLRISDAFSDISNISFSIVNAESYSVHMQDKDNIFSKREMVSF